MSKVDQKSSDALIKKMNSGIKASPQKPEQAFVSIKDILESIFIHDIWLREKSKVVAKDKKLIQKDVKYFNDIIKKIRAFSNKNSNNGDLDALKSKVTVLEQKVSSLKSDGNVSALEGLKNNAKTLEKKVGSFGKKGKSITLVNIINDIDVLLKSENSGVNVKDDTSKAFGKYAITVYKDQLRKLAAGKDEFDTSQIGTLIGKLTDCLYLEIWNLVIEIITIFDSGAYDVQQLLDKMDKLIKLLEEFIDACRGYLGCSHVSILQKVRIRKAQMTARIVWGNKAIATIKDTKIALLTKKITTKNNSEIDRLKKTIAEYDAEIKERNEVWGLLWRGGVKTSYNVAIIANSLKDIIEGSAIKLLTYMADEKYYREDFEKAFPGKTRDDIKVTDLADKTLKDTSTFKDVEIFFKKSEKPKNVDEQTWNRQREFINKVIKDVYKQQADVEELSSIINSRETAKDELLNIIQL